MKRFLLTLLVMAGVALASAQTPEDFGGDFTEAAAAGYYTYPAELAGIQPAPGVYEFDARIVLYENAPWSVAISPDNFFDITVGISEDQSATISGASWWTTIPWDDYCGCYLTPNDPPAGTFKIDALTFHGDGSATHWTGALKMTGSIGPWWGWKVGAFRTATELYPKPAEPDPATLRIRTTTRTRRGGERRPK